MPCVWHSWYACAAYPINLLLLFLLIKQARQLFSNHALFSQYPPAWDADASIVTAIWWIMSVRFMFAGITGKETPLSLDLLLLPPRLQSGMWKYGAVNPILLPEL